tara:strand:+ start:401 stop:1297 length:897 start_codon:yes stop_codon:yes gene_type:complete
MINKPENYDFNNIYSDDYIKGQAKKFLLRKIRDEDVCHWHDRIKLFCDEIIERLDLPKDAKYLDLGCNIGTFAIELAFRGKQAIGLDLSGDALIYAEAFSTSLGLKNRPKFIKGDASEREIFQSESFDAILAEDIFEHLHENLLVKTINNCAHWLKPGGFLVFHTHPTKYDYLFHSRGWKSVLALLPVTIYSLIHRERKFKRMVENYHRYVMNPISKLKSGKTHEEKIIHKPHCNLMTVDHLENLIQSAGMLSLSIKTACLYKRDRVRKRAIIFGKREYFHRNIYGIAWKPLTELLEL